MRYMYHRQSRPSGEIIIYLLCRHKSFTGKDIMCKFIIASKTDSLATRGNGESNSKIHNNQGSY